MTLFINGNNLNNPFWGLSRVSFEFIRSLDWCLSQPGRIKPFGDAVLLGRVKDNPIPGLRSIRYEYIKAPNLYVWENVSIAIRTRGHPIVGFQGRNPIFKRDCATMIHGLQVFTQPDSYSKRARIEGRLFLPIIGKLHRTILTGSHYSAAEIAQAGIASPDRIAVVHNGVDHREIRTEGVGPHEARLNLIPRRYVVAQSTTKAHKNINILLEAFTDPALADMKLVLFGGDGREAFEAKGLKIPPNVIFAGMVGDEALRDLLRHALCLAFPSLTEGFGLPPLEAMALGTPAIVSDRGAIPEICADAAMGLDATDSQEWVRGIKRLETEPALWEQFSRRGLARAAFFTWARAGERLYDVLVQRHSAA